MKEVPSPEQEFNPEWQTKIREGMTQALENYNLLYELSEEGVYTPIDFSPISLTETEDERQTWKLNPEELKFLRQELFQQVGFDPNNPIKAAEPYEYEIPEDISVPENQLPPTVTGKVEVHIYKTAREEEGMYLHELRYGNSPEKAKGPEYSRDYVIAPLDYHL